MSKEVRIELSDGEFEMLESFKEEYGLTWKGVLKHGIFQKELDTIHRKKEAERRIRSKG